MSGFYYFVIKQAADGRLEVYTQPTTPPREQFDSQVSAFSAAQALSERAVEGEIYLAFESSMAFKSA